MSQVNKLEACQIMPKYLVRRLNRFGQWEHVDTWDYQPDVNSVAQRYGPGQYHILIAEERVRGLQSFMSFTVPFAIEFVAFFPEEPNVEYIKANYPAGNYFVIGQSRKVTPIVVSSGYERDSQRNGMVLDLMTRGSQAMRSTYVLVRVTGLPYEYSI